MALAAVVGAIALLAAAAADDHDCIVRQPGAPVECVSPLVEDASCRGLNTTDIKGWHSMECDYAIYDIKGPQPTNKWIVIHAGGCDFATEDMGDYAHEATGYNLFGLRPCVGYDFNTCGYNRSTCDSLHVSWTMPLQPRELGLGFNPPALIEYARNPDSRLLFQHEFDGLPSYQWAGGCNATHPAYICVFSSDPEDVFDRKFYGESDSGGIKELLESMGNSEYMNCKIEVVDARNSSEVPGEDNGPTWGKVYKTNRSPDVPCSGIFPQIVTQGWAWEFQGQVSAGMKLAIMKQAEGNGTQPAMLESYVEAIRIALDD